MNSKSPTHHSSGSEIAITALSLAGILAHLALRYGWKYSPSISSQPLLGSLSY